MIVRPYKTRAPRHAVGFVLPNGRVVMEDGTTKKIWTLPSNAHANQVESIRLYADHHTIVSRFAMRGKGDLDMFNRKWFAWWPDPDHKVLLLKDDPGNGPEVLEGLVVFRDFLAARGASIGSVGASTRSLLRTTLSEPLRAGVGIYGPKAITAENMGGRQQSFLPASYYHSFVHLDLEAAYARTLGNLFYDPAGEWFASTKKTIPDTPSPVIVRARIRYPLDLDLAPLPRRSRNGLSDYETRDWPTLGTMTGTYEARELTCALEAGCDVKIEQVWVRQYMENRPNHHPFRRWWRVIRQARALPDYAGHLGKMAGAALWGTFIGEGELYRIHYEDSREVRWTKLRSRVLNRMYAGYDVAEIVTALIRARLYRELIVPAHAADRLIGVHTDGGLVVGASPVPGVGHDFVPKYTGALQYITPNMFRFREPGARGWEYVMAGVPDRDCSHAFEEKWLVARGRTAQGHFGMLEITDETAERRLREAFA